MRVSAGKKLSLRLDTELVERLQDYADRERVPVSFVLRHLVLRFLSDPTKDTGRRNLSMTLRHLPCEFSVARFSSLPSLAC